MALNPSILWEKKSVEFNHDLYGVTVTQQGEYLVCSDDNMVWKVDLNKNAIPYAGTPGVSGMKNGHRLREAQFVFNRWWRSLYARPSGQILIGETGTNCIRCIDDEQVTTFAGSTKGWRDGPRDQALFYSPMSFTEVDNEIIFLTDVENHRIRIIDCRTGLVSTVGNGNQSLRDGDPKSASFFWPIDLCFYRKANAVVVSDASNNALRYIDITTLHTHTPATSKSGFSDPRGIWTTSLDEFVVCNNYKGEISHYNPENRTHTTLIKDDTTKAVLDVCLASEFGELAYVCSGSPVLRLVSNFCQPNDRSSSNKSHIDFSRLLSSNLPILADALVSIAGNQYHLHSIVLSFHGTSKTKIENAIETIVNKEIPRTIWAHFVTSCLYGKPFKLTPNEPFEDCKLLSYLIYISRHIHIQGNYLEEAFVASLSRVSQVRMTEILLHVWKECDKCEDLMDLVIQFLRQHKSKWAAFAASEFERLSFTMSGADWSKFMIIVSKVYLDTPLYCPKASIGKTSQLRRRVKKLELEWRDPVSSPDRKPNTFTIGIEDHLKVLDVNTLVLCSQWIYFERMFQAGLEESRTRFAALPSGFPPNLLYAIILLLYRGSLDGLPQPLSTREFNYVLTRGAEYYLVQVEDCVPVAPFHPLIYAARSKLFEPLSVTNCIDQLALRSEASSAADQALSVAYLVQNFKEATTANPVGLARLPHKVLLEVMEKVKEIDEKK